jgi:hypothetical protein
MLQRLGKNPNPTLSVFETMDFFGHPAQPGGCIRPGQEDAWRKQRAAAQRRPDVGPSGDPEEPVPAEI